MTGAKLNLAANTLCALTIAVIVAFIQIWQILLFILAFVRFLRPA